MPVRLFLIFLLCAVFAIGVTCAVVCPESVIDRASETDGACTDCVSTHFMADGKTLPSTPTDAAGPGSAFPIRLAPARAPALPAIDIAPPLDPPRSTSTVFRV